jgi:hypothetical protein
MSPIADQLAEEMIEPRAEVLLEEYEVIGMARRSEISCRCVVHVCSDQISVFWTDG